MKRINLLMIGILISLGSFAQVDSNEEMVKHHEAHKMSSDSDIEARAMMYADKVTTRLNLTLEQKEKIKQAQITRLQRDKDMMAGMLKDQEGEKNKADKMEIQKDFKSNMKKILNDSQYKKWETMHEREMKMQGKKKLFKIK